MMPPSTNRGTIAAIVRAVSGATAFASTSTPWNP